MAGGPRRPRRPGRSSTPTASWSAPGRSPAGSTVELGQVAADAATGPTAPRSPGPGRPGVPAGAGAMTRRSGYADDIALLVAELTRPPAPLHLDLVADDGALPARARGAGDAGWSRCGCASSTTSSCSTPSTSWSPTWWSTPTSSAVAPRSAHRRRRAAPDRRRGDPLRRRWCLGCRRTPAEGRGRGLSMVRGMVDRLVVRGNEDGTVATVRHRLSRPAWMLTGYSTPARSAAGGARRSLHLRRATRAGLHLAGSLDHARARRPAWCARRHRAARIASCSTSRG